MKRILLPLLVLGALAATALVPAASAAPAAPRTLQGVVVGKDRAHGALVVARPNGAVQLVIAPKALTRTAFGRKVVVRYSTLLRGLPLATAVTAKGLTHRAVVRGTIVRLAGRQAVLNAGGSLLRVTLPATKARRSLASAKAGPGVGDTVKVEIEIDDDGSLDADDIVMAKAPATQTKAAGELEVRGKVSALTPATATAAGSISVTVAGVVVTCTIPAGTTSTVKVGDLIELECELVGDPGTWTLRTAEDEDEHSSDHAGSGGTKKPSGGDGAPEVEVRGTIAAPFSSTSTTVTVTPTAGGPSVTCAIVAGSLTAFAAGDSVKMECRQVGGALTLKEIEKADGTGKAEDDDQGDDHHGDDEDDDDDHDDGGHDDD